MKLRVMEGNKEMKKPHVGYAMKTIVLGAMNRNNQK